VPHFLAERSARLIRRARRRGPGPPGRRSCRSASPHSPGRSVENPPRNVGGDLVGLGGQPHSSGVTRTRIAPAGSSRTPLLVDEPEGELLGSWVSKLVGAARLEGAIPARSIGSGASDRRPSSRYEFITRTHRKLTESAGMSPSVAVPPVMPICRENACWTTVPTACHAEGRRPSPSRRPSPAPSAWTPKWPRSSERA
jgi:hypothetical protein